MCCDAGDTACIPALNTIKLTTAFVPSLRLSPIPFARTPLRALPLLRCLSRINQFIRISRTLLVVIAVAITQEKSQMLDSDSFHNLDSAMSVLSALALPITASIPAM